MLYRLGTEVNNTILIAICSISCIDQSLSKLINSKKFFYSRHVLNSLFCNKLIAQTGFYSVILTRL